MLEIVIALVNIDAIAAMYGYTVMFLYVMFLYRYGKRKRILVNPMIHIPVWGLALSGFLFALRYTEYSMVVSLVVYCMVPTLAFIAGYTITGYQKESAVPAAKRALGAIAVGCGIHVGLNLYQNLGIDRWHTKDFFQGSMAATNLGSLNILIFSLVPCLLITKNKKKKAAGLVLTAISVIYAFILGTRTQFYALAILTAVCGFFYLRTYYAKRVPVSTAVKWIGTAAVVIGAAVIVYRMDLFEIRTKVAESNFIYRFLDPDTAASDHYRFQLIGEGIKNLWDYPLGGNKGASYFHNYWLDIGRVSGVVPVFLMVMFDLTVVVHMFRLFRQERIDREFRYAILGLYIGFLLNFFMEPIMDGYVSLFYRFTFINGMVEGVYCGGTPAIVRGEESEYER